MAARWNKILFLISFWNYCSCTSFPVPLLIWSYKSLDVHDEISAGHTLQYKDLQDNYLGKLSSQSNTICIFVQDKLSIDDFATYPSTQFEHLKDVLTLSSTLIVLPSVSIHSNYEQDNNNKLVEYFKKKLEAKVLSLSDKDLPNLKKKVEGLKKDELNIIIVHLPSSQGEEKSDRNLMASDNVIGKISEELAKYFPDYVGLLTANMPRDDILAGMEENRQILSSQLRTRRDAEPTSDGCSLPGVVVKDRGHVKLYFRTIILGNKTQSDFLKKDQNLSISASGVETKRNITLNFEIPSQSFKNGSEIKLSFLFKVTGPYWSCVSINVTGTLFSNPGRSIVDHFDCSSDSDKNVETHMDVPANRSYACGHYAIQSDKNNTLIMKDFQVDPQQTSNESFSDSVNCVGFFTPPIWMGLLTTGVLVAILYGGVLSLLSIKCMDRFDNPNDPTIVIHNE